MHRPLALVCCIYNQYRYNESNNKNFHKASYVSSNNYAKTPARLAFRVYGVQFFIAMAEAIRTTMRFVPQLRSLLIYRINRRPVIF
jgi:hypothetical protein